MKKEGDEWFYFKKWTYAMSIAVDKDGNPWIVYRNGAIQRF